MTQKHFASILIIFALLACSFQQSLAQTGEERPYKSTKISKTGEKTIQKTDEKAIEKTDDKTSDKAALPTKKEEASAFTDFKSHLWYGGGLGLGFGSYNGYSSFGLGISPMVGYKFLKFLSAGPRLSLYYSSLKVPGFSALGLLNTEAGVFLRAHVYRGFFLQGDLSTEWVQQPTDQYQGTTIIKRTFSRGNQYLGIGYNFGRGEGGGGSEISIHYNFAVASDINSIEQPIDYRFAFTWRF
ncbi:MAG: hypothetical protein WCR52_02325 [Bacteroidota bacterium]